MKTKCTSLLVAAVAAVAFVGCTSDDDFAPQRESSGVKQSLTFTANVNGGGAKCYAYGRQKTHLMTDGRKVAFDAGDAISVFDGEGNNNAFTTQDDGATATFMGEAVETANYTALYPYQEGASLDGTTLTATLPTEQKAVPDSYDPQANLSVATTTKEAMSFGFKNVCALVQFETAEPLKKVVFHGNSSEKVAGTLSIDMSDADAPTATGSATSITLQPAEGEAAIPAGTYYIAVLPQTFSEGFRIASYKDDSETADQVLRIDESITLTRSYIMDLGSIAVKGHEFVDLGIEVDGNKVLWARMNIGATTPEGYGDYFAWGETTPYYDADAWWADGKTGSFAVGGWKTTPKDYSTKGYNWVNYAWCNGSQTTLLTKYNNKESNGTVDNKTQLELADDAAHVIWGGDWVIPTKEEWTALCNTDNCKREWTTLNNVKGWKFTSKKDSSKSIFFPAAGCINGTSIYYVGLNGFCWSSSLYADDSKIAYYFSFGSTVVYSDYHTNNRYYGQSVRPVLRIPVSQ